MVPRSEAPTSGAPPGDATVLQRPAWSAQPGRSRLPPAPALHRAATSRSGLASVGARRLCPPSIRLPAANTKAGRKLDLPMADFVYDLLTARGSVGREGPFVFPAESKSGHIEEPAFPLDQVANSTGIRVSAHDLRRTFVTTAESTDISPLALSALVNHSLGRDVTSGYVVMTAERLRGPAQRVCDRIKALCGVSDQ